MVELNPEARRLLDVARTARTPSLEDRERVLAALLVSVAAASVAPSVAAVSKSGLLGKLAGKSVTLWIKAAASVAVLSTAAVSAYAYARLHARPAVAAPVTVLAAAHPASGPLLAPPPAPIESVAAPALPPMSVAPVLRRRTIDRPSAELVLLHQASDARRAGQPERTLELTREHAEKYPHSQRWAERETLRVLALCDLGRVEAARTSAAPLQYLWSSPLRATLNASCASK